MISLVRRLTHAYLFLLRGDELSLVYVGESMFPCDSLRGVGFTFLS